MAHSTNKISSIKLPGSETLYEIHDAQAIHSVEELGLSSALVFKGTKAAVSNLPSTGNKVGDVWYVTDDDCEYVWTDSEAWEAFGNVHDAASSNHTHNVTVTGTNEASAVTGNVAVPTVSRTQKYLTATNSAPTVTPTTTTITASASGTAVGADGTAKAITGFGNHTTSTALGTDATFKVTGGAASTSKMVTSIASKVTVSNKSIPNVTGNETVKASKVSSAGSRTNGTAASWGASVVNGVLSFSWTANTPTEVTLPTFTEVSATNTVLGTEISASSVTASDVTVATGALASNGTGSSVATDVSAISVEVDNACAVSAITALGTPTTANALTGVQVTAQPTVTVNNGDGIMTGVTVNPSTITLTETNTTSTGAVPVVSDVTIDSAMVSLQNGSAAAQKWTQTTGSTGAPQNP